eukprot:14860-Heterococcus_DN1.PRE.1
MHLTARIIITNMQGSREIVLGSQIYIESTDFRSVDSSDYFGLAPGKLVGLKYAGTRLLRCDEVVYEDTTTTSDDTTISKQQKAIKELKCSLVDMTDGATRPKGTLSWVPVDNAVSAEVRLYNHLFTVPTPATDDTWEKQLNPESEVVVTTAVVDPSVKNAVAGTSYQFERLGFFVVDRDSRTDAVGGKLVFNRTATLRDGAGKPAATDTTTTNAKNAPGRSRKEEQQAALAAKEAMKNVKPEDMFSTGPDASSYSKYDNDGIPTHTTDGEPLSKSQFKKLKKDWDKQKKLYEQVQAALYISVSMAARDSFAKDAAADVCAAVCASLLVSPAITIVDRSIMQNASGVMK